MIAYLGGSCKMKKIITLSISLVLIVAALFCSYVPAGFTAGRGNGENEEVTDTETLSDVIKDTCKLLNFGSTYSVEPMSSLSIAKGKSYESVTLVYDTDAESRVTLHNGEHMYSTVKAKMTVYIDADGRAIISLRDAVVDIDIKYGSVSQRFNVSYDADLYISESVVAVKYHKVSTSLQGMPSSLIGRWIDVRHLPGDFTNIFQNLLQQTKNYLGLIDKYLSEYSEDGFIKRGDKYSMMDEYLESFIKEQFSLANDNTIGAEYTFEGCENQSMTIDLSSVTEPTIETDAKEVEYEAYVDTGTSSGKVRAECQYTDYSRITITNINNTVIDFDEDIILNEDVYF